MSDEVLVSVIEEATDEEVTEDFEKSADRGAKEISPRKSQKRRQ